jgi:predicted metal-dependent hydrolase
MSQTKANANTMSQTPFDIPVRRDIVWDFEGVEKNFVEGGNPLISFLWAAFSAGATPIEGFFIKALRPTLESISDDNKLLEDCRNMIEQERAHSAAHAKLNKHLKSVGYDIDSAQVYFRKVLRDTTEGLSPVDLLGVVAAGEHALYSFAQVWFKNPEMAKKMQPKVRRLFHYHVLEEAEHGAVSHDQYRYFAKNNYWHRLKTAKKALVVFAMLTEASKIFSQGFDYKPTVKQRWEFFVYCWVKPGILRQMVACVLEYLSPWYNLEFTHEDLENFKIWNDELYAGQSELAQPEVSKAS